MRITLPWLKEFLPGLSWSDTTTAEKLTVIGHETEVLSRGLLDVSITANRPDCHSVVGLARDVAAAYGLKFAPPENQPLAQQQFLPVVIDKNANQDVIADVLLKINNYSATASPKELVEKMKVLMLEPKDLLIDISNIVAHEFGIPLHVFDGEKIASGLVIRRAKNNEKITVLNGKSLNLGPTNLVQESGGALVDLAGIMGGSTSAVGPTTKSLVVQGAVFAPATIRQSSRGIGLVTVAAGQYGRGVDDDALLAAMSRFWQLALRHAPGLVADGLQIVRQQPNLPQPISAPKAAVGRLLGRTIDEQDYTAIATTGFSRSGETITPPRWRQDVRTIGGVADEIVRLRGYSTIKKKTLKPIVRIDSSWHATESTVKAYLAALGLTETLTRSLGAQETHRRVTNPSSNTEVWLRSSLKNGLLETIGRNPFIRTPAFFEVGDVFDKRDERPQLGLAVWRVTDELQQFLASFGHKPTWHEVSTEEKEQYGIRLKKLFYWEADLDWVRWPSQLPAPAPKTVLPIRPISKFPPASRDITLVFTATAENEELVRKEFLNGKETILCEVVDRFYDDEKIGMGKVAATFRLLLQKQTGSITDDQVNKIIHDHFQRLKKEVSFDER
jgi:phenylalanyl-tRNA synthetase beta subunit